MSRFTKADYVLRSLGKISRKKWEYFIISRIIHRLDDLDIEFVTQQLVRLSDGTYALTDIYFPQFALHLEIDERQHLSESHANLDERRARDVVSATTHEIRRIAVAEAQEEHVSERQLEAVKKDVDDFISYLVVQKRKFIEDGIFVPWDFEGRFSPKRHKEVGYISVEDNVLFRRQSDALQCFGFEGNLYQRAYWPIGDQSDDVVWFPRLRQYGDWLNELTPDGQILYERALTEKGKESIVKQRQKPRNHHIIFAKAEDALGRSLYRYIGTFRMNLEEKAADVIRFDLVRTRENVRSKPKQ